MEQFLKAKSDDKGKVDVTQRNVEDVHEVDKVEQQDKFMTAEHYSAEFVPHVLEEYW